MNEARLSTRECRTKYFFISLTDSSYHQLIIVGNALWHVIDKDFANHIEG